MPAKYKKGDKVTTIHGEKLTVLDVRTLEDVTDKAVLVRKGQTLILAESGGHNCWFPESKLED